MFCVSLDVGVCWVPWARPVATLHAPTGLPALVSSHRDGRAPTLVPVSGLEEGVCSWTSRQAARSQGRTSSLHESSLVTSATKPRRQTSRPCSERWVRSRKSFFRSTGSLIARVGLPFVEFGDAATVSEAIKQLDGTELNGRNLRVSEARDRAPRPPGGAMFMDDGRPPWTSGADPRNPKAAVAAFEAENVGSRPVSLLHTIRRRR